MVFDNSLETNRVKKIPNNITKITLMVETIEAPNPLHCTSNKNSCNRY